MELHNTLTTITVISLAISFIAAITSQLWKGSVEIEGKLKKRLTPAGWLSLGIALVGLSTSVGSELIRVSIRNNEQLQKKTQVAQEQALKDQETRWRIEVSEMLENTKTNIEKNIEGTIKGFHDNEMRFNRTQADIASSKQSLMASSLHHTNQIVIAGQPLASLSLAWAFRSSNKSFWKTMRDGQEQIEENNMSSQGGVTRSPFEYVEYEAAVLPLISYVARLADDQGTAREDSSTAQRDTTVVLIPLDESHNTILSFGQISDVTWQSKREENSISWGFLGPEVRDGGTPTVVTGLASNPRRGPSSYALHWSLDPTTLPKAINQKNSKIQPMAKLPRILKVAILYDGGALPFEQNNFGITSANLWESNEFARKYVSPGSNFRDATLTIEVNGFQQQPYSYRLKRMYRLTLMDGWDEEFDIKCTMLEFEAT